MTTSAPTTAPRVVSAVQKNSVSFKVGRETWTRPTYAAAIYEPRARVKDGVQTYRRIFIGDEGFFSFEKAKEAAQALAAEKGLPFLEGVKQGSLVAIH